MFFRALKTIKDINLATRITLFRVVIILPILLLLNFPNMITCFIAMTLFCIASISDWVDGYIARTQKQVTTLGKFLDPLADKLLICTILIELASLGWVSAWIVNIIITRELAITGLRAIAADSNIVIAADIYGKWKTGFQIAALIPLIMHYPLFGIPFHEIGSGLLYIATLLTILSGANYCLTFFRMSNKKENFHKENSHEA